MPPPTESPVSPVRVVSLARYPVKAMAGEALEEATLDARGLVGDRAFAVVDADGRFATGKDSRRFRRHDEIFEYDAATGASGRVLVRHRDRAWPVGDPVLDVRLSLHFGSPMRVLPEVETPHFDAGAVSLVGTATLDWVAEQTAEPADWRRIRPNLVVATTQPFVEESWVGKTLTIGRVQLRVTERIERCRMIDLEQAGVAAPAPWLKLLGAEREVCLGVYAEVFKPGRVRTGHQVRVGRSAPESGVPGSRVQ